MFAERTACKCPCSPLRPRPGRLGPWGQPLRPRCPQRHPGGPPGPISPGGDRSRCLTAAETHALARRPRLHNLNPSPTLRELQVTDHVGLTPGRSGSAPAPGPGFAGSAPSSAKPPGRGERRGAGVGRKEGGKGERREEKLTLRLPGPLPPAAPRPLLPAPRPTPSPLPPLPCIQGAGRPRGDIFSCFFLLHF